MGIATPWLNSGPSLFLDAVRSGTEASIAKTRNDLERRQQDLQDAQASARNALESRSIDNARLLNQGRLAQANAALQLRSQLGEGKLDEANRHNQELEGYYTGRLNLGSDRLAEADKKNSDLKDFNDQRIGLLSDRLKLAQEIAAGKTANPKDTSPTVTIGGGHVHVDDPQLQDYLNTPQDSVTTNSNWPHWLNGPDTYATNHVLPDINSLTNKSDLLSIFKPSGSGAAQKSRFKVLSVE